jgi:putative membrane protein
MALDQENTMAGRITLALAGALPLAATGTARAQGAGTGAPGVDQQQLLSQMHHVDQMEIQFGRLAEANSQSKAVRNFGKRLVKDHEKLDKKITAFAKKNSVQLIEPTPTNQAQQAETQREMTALQQLRGLQGPEFDKEFLSTMVQGHSYTLGQLQNEEGNIQNRQLKNLVKQSLPLLEQHRREANRLLARETGTKTPGMGGASQPGGSGGGGAGGASQPSGSRR